MTVGCAFELGFHSLTRKLTSCTATYQGVGFMRYGKDG